MKTVIVYPVPMETEEVWRTFKPFVERFLKSLRDFDPGTPYELALICNVGHSGDTGEKLYSLWETGVPKGSLFFYPDSGCDIGSFQWYSHHRPEPCFQVNCVSRVYAWKDGWLKKLVDARNLFGPGLYGTSCSREGGKLHICTRCYAWDSEDFKEYPTKITSRDQGVFFELGEGCVYEWFKGRGLQTRVVYQSYAISADEFNSLNHKGAVYRRLDQRELLVKDKHSDAFDQADPFEQERLRSMCFNDKV